MLYNQRKLFNESRVYQKLFFLASICLTRRLFNISLIYELYRQKKINQFIVTGLIYMRTKVNIFLLLSMDLFLFPPILHSFREKTFTAV